jgi:hypothetical protein
MLELTLATLAPTIQALVTSRPAPAPGEQVVHDVLLAEKIGIVDPEGGGITLSLTSHDGAGLLRIVSKNRKIVAKVGAVSDSGNIVLTDHMGQTKACLSVPEGEGSLDLASCDGQRMVSFGTRGPSRVSPPRFPNGS